MNLTLSVKEDVVERARKAARARGTSLNQMVRQYLEELGGLGEPDREIRELRQLSSKGGGRSRGWRFDRDEIHARS
jgi:hypothetical protein